MEERHRLCVYVSCVLALATDRHNDLCGVHWDVDRQRIPRPVELRGALGGAASDVERDSDRVAGRGPGCTIFWIRVRLDRFYVRCVEQSVLTHQMVSTFVQALMVE